MKHRSFMRLFIMQIVLFCLVGCHSQADGVGLTVGERAVQGYTPRTARDVFSAFQAAYPGRIKEVSFQNGDWTIVAGDTRFYWAGGRILPEADLPAADRYSLHPFYPYPEKLSPVPEFDDEMKARIRKRVSDREENRLYRHPGIFNALWRLSDRDSAERHIVTMRFLSIKVRVHEDILPALALIEKEIVTRMESDVPLRQFVSGIETISGQHWRTIAHTASLSLHSYGIALDVISPNPENKETYWIWAMQKNPEWFTEPLTRRHLPPESFIEIFEKHGFLWGGKWFYFDTIHFEYRPELLFLNGFRIIPVVLPSSSVRNASMIYKRSD